MTHVHRTVVRFTQDDKIYFCRVQSENNKKSPYFEQSRSSRLACNRIKINLTLNQHAPTFVNDRIVENLYSHGL